jgi:hypothetical protein
VVVALATVIGAMALTPSSRQPLALTLTVTAIAVTTGLVWQRRRFRKAGEEAARGASRALERADGGE